MLNERFPRKREDTVVLAVLSRGNVQLTNEICKGGPGFDAPQEVFNLLGVSKTHEIEEIESTARMPLLARQSTTP